MVDCNIRTKLDKAEDAKEIAAILEGPGMIWNNRMRCLKHHDTVNGCSLPATIDIEPWPK